VPSRGRQGGERPGDGGGGFASIRKGVPERLSTQKGIFSRGGGSLRQKKVQPKDLNDLMESTEKRRKWGQETEKKTVSERWKIRLQEKFLMGIGNTGRGKIREKKKKKKKREKEKKKKKKNKQKRKRKKKKKKKRTLTKISIAPG